MMSRNCLVPFRSVPLCCLMAVLPAATVLAAPDIDDIEDIGDMLEVMAADLATQGGGCDGAMRVGEPSIVEDMSGVVFASSPVLLVVDGTTEASGTTLLSVDPDLVTVDSVTVITRDSVTYTLSLSVELDDDELHICGYISYYQSPSTIVYEGGWTYTVAHGLETDEGTDEELAETLIEVFGCDPQAALALSLANLLQDIVNGIALVVNYVVDFFTPYTPPTQCDGPLFYDGSGQSCDGVSIPCKDDLSDMSELIDGMPGASNALKKCMKGRAGCGGSAFERLRISCDDPDDCGPCGELPGENDIIGCSRAGTRIWYCAYENIDVCGCLANIFHEMSHSCGQPDDPDCPPLGIQNCPLEEDPAAYDGACRIGLWWNGECCELEVES